MSRLEKIAVSRQKLLTQYPGIIEQVSKIREQSVEKLPEMIKQAKESLEGKLAKVYFAKDSTEAAAVLKEIIKNEKQVARSYSTTLEEIDFDRIMSEQGTEVKLTRFEEIVKKEKDLPSTNHPHFSTLDLPPQVIEEALSQYVNTAEKSAPAVLKELAHAKVKEDILHSEFGITGLNSIIVENGSIVLIEEEGNVRAVSNLPYRHVVVAGLDKLNWSAEDSMSVLQATTIFGIGRNTPTYFSLIAGPSRTADIEFKMAYGMHGPKEVHVILLDNGRMALREQGAGALLKCINCGSCYESCAAAAEKQGWKDTVLSAKGIALGIIQGKIPPLPVGETMPDFICPVGLTAKEVTQKLSQIQKL
jgi:L-lactate utilization protein LutB